ncbi:MAG: hypothetical protein IGR80_04760 [Synechococcales cyanobacterium K44_A2020_017]|nr:hypothetical protein [Synechococcales cyanobacterium K32_A2020_035]MBF2094050.1 hypothetical protein [Synechococcales cyanobacterium K44_A2020_017]
MVSKTSKKRLFCGMGYREVQRSNSTRKAQLTRAQQQWLRKQGQRNVGWENIIKLYHALNDLQYDSDEPTLEELFLKAERIGNKYQTSEEIQAFNQALNAEVAAISEEIDRQFPDNSMEVIDYSKGV